MKSFLTILLLLCVLVYSKKKKKNQSPCDPLGASGNTAECSINPAAVWARTIIPHPISAPVMPSLPRIAVDDMDAPENEAYKQREKPFIMTHAMKDWGLLTSWKDGKRLSQFFPRAVCDYYPYNMLENTHPYLIRFNTGLSDLTGETRFRDENHKKWTCKEGCRYLHMQLTPKMWDYLETVGDIAKDKYAHFKGDSWWMRRCMPNEDVQEEYFLKTHWRIVLIGSTGSGMFNHTDSLLTASWHGHVQGKKWWYVCKDGKCFESVLEPGEVLYYGKSWWHHTRNLEPITSTITGTVVTPGNFRDISRKLYGECVSSELRFDFSGALCDALDKCYGVWSKVLAGKEEKPFRPWREVASAEEIQKRDKMKPTDNNYDGRNFITE